MSEVAPALAGRKPWTTGERGAAYVACIAASILLPGTLALWAALAMQRRQQQAAAGSSGGGSASPRELVKSGVAAVAGVAREITSAATAAGGSNGSSGSTGGRPSLDATKKELTRHLLSEDESTPRGTPTAAGAAAAAAANPLASGSGSSGSWGASSAAAAAAAMRGFAVVRPAAAGGSSGSGAGGWELVLPADFGAVVAAATAGAGDRRVECWCCARCALGRVMVQLCWCVSARAVVTQPTRSAVPPSPSACTPAGGGDGSGSGADVEAGRRDTGSAAAAAAAGAHPLASGRPPLQPLITAWLAGLKQLPTAATGSNGGSSGGSSGGRVRIDVFGMGPSRLVEDTKLLCDAINAGKSDVWLRFVQKTHEL
jgi:hypothetical protein